MKPGNSRTHILQAVRSVANGLRFRDMDWMEAARQHGLEEWPNEAAGMVVQRPGSQRAEQYIPVIQRNPDPMLAEWDFDALQKLAPPGAHVVRLVHSHTNGILQPSDLDMETALNMRSKFGWVMDFTIHDPQTGKAHHYRV